MKLKSLLAPLVLMAVAALIAFVAAPAATAAEEGGSPVQAQTADDNHGESAAQHNGLPESSQVDIGGHLAGGPTETKGSPTVVGSGRENYYVPQATDLPQVANPGKYLYEQGCSTCHGLNGRGGLTDGKKDVSAPSLWGVGKAAVDFYVGSGRMPVSNIVVQAPRKQPIYTQAQINAIADYVSTSFGGGPEVPVVNLANGDLAEGNKLYASNCAQCHNSAGSGGSLGRNYNAPRLYLATPTEVAEAIRVGPSAMPQFGPETFSDQQVDSIVKYVKHLGTEAPGGYPLGNTGPVPEGYFAWFIGIGACLVLARWIGTRV